MENRIYLAVRCSLLAIGLQAGGGSDVMRRSSATDVPGAPAKSVPASFTTRGPKSAATVNWERIFVLDDANKVLGEYALNDECPIEIEDLTRSLPVSGLRHLVSFYQGEYAFTPFLVDSLWFVLVTRGIPRIEERGSIGTLLAAARLHIPPAVGASLARRDLEMGERERTIGARELDLVGREQRLALLDTDLRLAATRLREKEAELSAQETTLNALRDYAVELQRSLVPPRPAKSGDSSTDVSLSSR